MAEITLALVSPGNARRPVSSSYSTQPNEKMSARASTSFPSSCSGAMYGTVPSTAPGVVAGSSAVSSDAPAPTSAPAPGRVNFARPKSSSFTCSSPARAAPVVVSITFPGFRSR